MEFQSFEYFHTEIAASDYLSLLDRLQLDIYFLGLTSQHTQLPPNQKQYMVQYKYFPIL